MVQSNRGAFSFGAGGDRSIRDMLLSFERGIASLVSAGHNGEGKAAWWKSDTALVVYIGLATVLLHAATGWRYGFHRDELATMEDARHLAWGYVAYPPITPLFARISLELFGTSLIGYRMSAWLAQAAAVVLTGLMAKEFGGRRGAQCIAAMAAVPFCLGGGAILTYISFDYICWVLAAYFVVRLLKSEDARWWVGIGGAIGLGMLAKYTMGFFALAIAGSVLLTDARRWLKSGWLWAGVALSILVLAPNLAWQARHGFVSLAFLKFIHTRDVSEGLTATFLPDQLLQTLLGVPLWLAGLHAFVFRKDWKRYRMLGWMYVLPLAMFLAAKGRGYYLAPAYPMLYAGGPVVGERWLATIEAARAKWIRRVAWTALGAGVTFASALALPMAPINSAWWKLSAKVDQVFMEEVGWRELTQTVAEIRDLLPESERGKVGIVTGNYGEIGALNLYGPEYGLPRATSGVNSSWERGYGEPAPEYTILLGFDRAFAEENFASCRLVRHPWNRYGVANEETVEHPDIFLCGPPKAGWPEFWRSFQFYA